MSNLKLEKNDEKSRTQTTGPQTHDHKRVRKNTHKHIAHIYAKNFIFIRKTETKKSVKSFYSFYFCGTIA